MGIKEYCLEMRGMPHRELEEYLLSIGGECDERGTYIGSHWEVTLSKTWTCSLGSIRIPATQVTFRMEEVDWPVFLRAFRLRFLSAGG